MDKGRIVEQGPPSILDHPQTKELTEFMRKVR
jgi:ABC-type arginine transport system ATPase subunit